MLKDEASYQKVLVEIYDLMQLESLTENQIDTLDKLAHDVEIYDTYDELRRLREALKSAEEDIKIVEALKGVSPVRKNYLLREAVRKRTSVLRQFVIAQWELYHIKKGDE